MNKLLRNKKADFTSIIIMITIIFALAISAIIFSKVFLEITEELKTQEDFSNNTIRAIEAAETNTIPLLDFFIFFGMISIIIGLIISSIYIDVHPAVIVLFIVASVVAVFISGIFANVFVEVSETPGLVATSTQFEMTNVLLGSNFPIIVLVVSMIVVVVLYGKSRRVGEV